MTRTLTQRELNRAVLARQGLLKRFGGPLPRVLERIGGIQAQYAPSIYIGLWSRVKGLERGAVTRALERRAVVQATLMRSTIHVVSRDDYWPIALTLREGRRTWWRRATKSEADLDEAAELARAALADGPKTRKELEALVGKARFNGLGLWLELVRVPPSGTWERRRADLYGLAEDWIGPPHADPTRLVRRYLQGFGPATVGEIASFAGLNAGEVDLSGLELRHFRTEDGAELVDLPRAPLPAAATPAPPRLLPTWDATLLVHVRRAGIIRESDRERIFSTKTPHSFPTFTIDGTVEGTWRHVDGRIELEPWRDVDTRALEAEAAALAQYLGEQ